MSEILISCVVCQGYGVVKGKFWYSDCDNCAGSGIVPKGSLGDLVGEDE